MWTCMPVAMRVAMRVAVIVIAAPLAACMSAEVPGDPASQSAGALAMLPKQLVARGTEPFWSIEIDGERLLWKTPEQPEGRWIPVKRRSGPQGARFAGHDGSTRLSLDVTAGRCSDGMSDLVYPYTAVWTYGAATLRGCALARD